MYLPADFVPHDAEVVAFLSRPRFAHLVTHSRSSLVATSLPLIFDRRVGAAGVFLGHVARANPQWSELDGDEALVIVSGADAYVSPTSYPSRRRTGRVVPTWNYVTVQGHGRLVVHDDAEWTLGLVRRLTNLAEEGQSEPWSLEEAPAEFIAGQAKAIVGIEVVLDRLEGKWKLSQNRSAEDRAGVLGRFTNGTAREQEVAAEMERTPPRA